MNDQTYQIIETIGQGSGGIVFKALHMRLNKEVVIKQIKGSAKQSVATRTDQLARDYTEAYGCYLKADEYYKQYTGNTGVSDGNMDSLRNAVNDLIGMGWLKI